MEDLIFVSAQPDVPYFHWQIKLYIYNFIKSGINPKQIHVLFSTNGFPSYEGLNIISTGVNVHFYKDERTHRHYIPSIKPYLVSKFIEEFPQHGKLLFLHDSDIIFRELPDFSSLIQGSTSYLSDTIGYIGHDYIKQCCTRYSARYSQTTDKELLDIMCSTIGIDLQTVEKFQSKSGGGQYLLKDTTFELWDKIYKDCTPLFDAINKYHKAYPIEYGGIQIWTAEMWSMLWNLWKFGIDTEITPLLDFSWATDPIKIYESKPILHLAGVTIHTKNTMFYKGEYIDINPIEIIKECPTYFDYVDKNNSTHVYINLIKDYVNSIKHV